MNAAAGDAGEATPRVSPLADALALAALAAVCFAVDPHAVGGVLVRSLPGPVRDRWLALALSLLPAGAPVRRVPLHVSDGRLLGGLDLAATLRAGRPVGERGVLADADEGVVVLAMAERVSTGTAAKIGAVLDAGAVVVERDGLAFATPARIGVIALDEGIAADELLPGSLRERLALHLDLTPYTVRAPFATPYDAGDVAAARARLPGVVASEAVIAALCATADALGVDSARSALQALRVARACAALDGRDEVDEDDAAWAARLVLAPRATRLPPQDAPEQEPPPPEPPQDRAPDDPPADEESPPPEEDPEIRPLEDVVLEAAQAAIPEGLLIALAAGEVRRSRAQTAGRAGALQSGGLRGRPSGVRRGAPRAGARLNVIETLRAAAPWQGVRRRERALAESNAGLVSGGGAGAGAGVDVYSSARSRARTAADGGRRAPRIEVRTDDFHVTRHRERAETTTIFVVDASGSSALHRLAEAKGAVELLLADCYVRRDRVAVIAFRGRGAELLLPPTRSLVRAKRSLAGLPGGGGTPLASAMDAAATLAEAVQRRGGTPTVVVLTDGRANVARDGSHDRARAEQDALASVRRLRAARVVTLLVDTSPRPQPQAQKLAQEMAATYLPLPHADARVLSTAVRAAVPAH